MPFGSDFYPCLLFCHPFRWTVCCLAKDRNQEQREKAFPSISLCGRMTRTALKEKPRDDGEKGMLDSQWTPSPCEASLFQTSQLIINCSSLAAASLYVILSVFPQQAGAIVLIDARTRNAIFGNFMECVISPYWLRARIGQLPVAKDT